MKRAALLFLCLVGCTSQKPEAATSRETTVRAQVPLRVTWQELSRSSTEAVVLAKVERQLGIAMPFSLSITLPSGVTAKEGRTSFTLLPNPEADVVSEKLVLTFAAVPSTDALLSVDGDSGAMGFHARVPYRFGRPEPLAVPPATTGPTLKKGETSYGPSVPLD